jgi:predicted nucleotidyltransferase
MTYDEALTNCIFRYLSGSHAYGLNTEESDEDYRGVFIAPLNTAFDLFQTSFMGQGSIANLIKNAEKAIAIEDYTAAQEMLRQAQEVDNGDLNFSVGTVRKINNDEELQELRKFMKLAANCNPNIIEFLYINDDDKTNQGKHLISHITPIWRQIRENRHMFLSKKARFTFSGYAIAQLKKIKAHRGYLLNPKGKPNRKDYKLPEKSLIPAEHQNALLSVPSEYASKKWKNVVLQEKRYRQCLNDFNSYKKWETERNDKRKVLEAKCGYDAKHACHLIRLCRMAEEILRDGVVLVKRPDAQELLNIRQGNVPYEAIIEIADAMDAKLDALYKTTTLRDKPDHKGIQKLYKNICTEFYGINY